MNGRPGVDPYSRPDLYDLEYADLVEDHAFYVSAAVGSAGPVLELGAGTGRLTIPIAQAGRPIVAVEHADAMRARLHSRAVAAGVGDRVEIVAGDFRTVRLGRRFAVVLLPFNALHHCADEDDLAGLFATVAAHLQPGGLFLFDAYLPDWELYARAPGRYEHRLLNVAGTMLPSWESSEWDPDTWTHHVWYHFGEGGTSLHLVLHMYPLATLRSAMADAGLRPESDAEDFDGTPLTRQSVRWVGRWTTQRTEQKSLS